MTTVTKEAHDKRIEEALEKARGMGKTEGYEWVVRTIERILPGGAREILDEKIEDRIIQIGVFKTEPARVVTQKGLTMNLGNFESCRTTTGFECPCYVEEMTQVADVLNNLVEERLQREVLEVRGKDIRPGYEAQRSGGK